MIKCDFCKKELEPNKDTIRFGCNSVSIKKGNIILYIESGTYCDKKCFLQSVENIIDNEIGY